MPTSSSSDLRVPADEPETPDISGAYPKLTDEQLMTLSRYGDRRSVPRGTVLFCEGDRDCSFFVVLEGKVAVVQETVMEPRLIAVHGPGRFLGDLSLLTGQTLLVTAVAATDTDVLEAPVERLKELLAADQALGDLILRAYILRRTLQANIGAGLRIIGSKHDPDARRLRDFASRNRIPHQWVDLDEDAQAEDLLRALDIPAVETPVVIWKGQRILPNPSNTQLADLIGLRAAPPRAAYDLVVVGAGPSGLAAAVYAASEGLSTVVLDAVATGGQAATSSQIENYLGFPAGITGGELADRAVVQARKFGAIFTIPGEATSLTQADGYHLVGLADGEDVTAHAVLLATGVHYRRLDVPGIDRLEGSSVYYAATEAEARLCRQDPVTVVGGGNSAGQAACFLARHSPTVNLVIRHDDLGRDMSRYLADRVQQSPRITIWRNSEVCELIGDEVLEEVVLRHLHTHDEQRLTTTVLFVLIGAAPNTSWLQSEIPLDAKGFVLTGPAAAYHDGLFETRRQGVFAVGDVRSGSVKRVASAVGEGSVVIRQVHEFLQARGRR
jgi:thioredoxin reductase (NADPH)